MRPSTINSAMIAALMAAAAAVPGAKVVVGGDIQPTARSAPKAAPDQPTQTTAAATWSTPATFADWWKRNRQTPAGGYKGPGWSNRHVQRLARKKRNQARHRKACRG